MPPIFIEVISSGLLSAGFAVVVVVVTGFVISGSGFDSGSGLGVDLVVVVVAGVVTSDSDSGSGSGFGLGVDFVVVVVAGFGSDESSSFGVESGSAADISGVDSGCEFSTCT